MTEAHVSSSRKRKHINQSNSDVESIPSSSSSNEQIDPSSTQIFSRNTCDWNRSNLDKLNITTITSRLFSPNSLIDLIQGRKDVKPNSDDSVGRCRDLILQSTNPLSSLDFDDVEEIQCSEVMKTFLMKFKDNWYRDIDAWDISKRNELDDRFDSRLCEKFRVHGEEFAHHLFYMTVMKKTQRLSRAMYQSLFQHFSAMFGLSSYVPSISGTCLTIGTTEVTSVPDLIFPDLSSVNENDEKLKVLAVCQIKGDFIKSEESTDRTTGDNEHDERVVLQHINDSLQGQHGGDLLVHFPLSTYQGLLGLIVQKTNVTFSYFDCNKMQFDEIHSCSSTIPNKPYIYYSKPYNYLRANDRKELIEPLLRLGFIQCNPYK